MDFVFEYSFHMSRSVIESRILVKNNDIPFCVGFWHFLIKAVPSLMNPEGTSVIFSNPSAIFDSLYYVRY